MNGPYPEQGEGGAEQNPATVIPRQLTGEEVANFDSTPPPAAIRMGRIASAANVLWSAADYVVNRHQRLTQRNYEKSAENVRARWLVYEQANGYIDPVNTTLMTLKEQNIISTDMSCLDVGTADGKSLSDLVHLMGDWKGDLYGLELNAQQYEHSKYWFPLYQRDAGKKGEWYTLVHGVANQQSLPKRARFIEGSVNAIPFQDGSVDLVMALYMLYHVEQPEQRKNAINELHRVISPDGVLVVSTSGEGNKPQHRLFEQAAAQQLSEELATKINPPRVMNKNFTTEVAIEELSNEFGHVYMFEYQGEFVIDTVEKYVIYRDSLLSMYDQLNPLPAEEAFTRAVDTILKDVGNRIGTSNPFRDTLSRAAFICTDNELRLDEKSSQFVKIK